jgi:hypothetical protein
MSKKKKDAHMFSIELSSRDYVKCLLIPTENDAKVLIEGFLGDLEQVGIIESVMLEIKGANGTLKMDLSEEEMSRLLHGKTEE